MNLTVEIPDDLVSQLNAAGGDLSRRALEALALEEYKSGHITKAEMRRVLGFSTRYELDGFLKAHNVWADYTIDDLHREIQDLQSLGL
jgi:predicted HTH domain antitoxin